MGLNNRNENRVLIDKLTQRLEDLESTVDALQHANCVGYANMNVKLEELTALFQRQRLSTMDVIALFNASIVSVSARTVRSSIRCISE